MVYVYLADGFEEMEAIVPVDLLRRGGVEVKTVSVHDRVVVHGAHGIDVTADLTLEEAVQTPCVAVLPGGLVGVENLLKSEVLCRRLVEYKAGGVTLAAICAAPTLLSSLGLVGGREVTCYPSCAPEITDGKYVDVRVCVRDGLITSAGPGTAADFGLALLAFCKDEATATSVGTSALFLK
ncbi:MAG: DJ-1/PfpI family protein [Clostridia bacterium]|nr:DJ-1/PfpI family protein [Clostridia bacterium]